MSTSRIVIAARIEEVPTLAQFSIDNLTRDTSNFTVYKPTKYGGFLGQLQTKKTTVDGIVFPVILLDQLKLITGRLITEMISLRPLMDHLEGYVRDAQNLTVSKKDFGVSGVRKAIAKDDQEALDKALKILEKNITDNLAALTAVNYPPPEQAQVQLLHGQINADNAAQNQKEEDKALLVQNNLGVINDLCKMLQDLWADGKSIYKSTNKTKLKDYTLAQLKNRIRQDELRTKLTGPVKNFQNVLQSGASVKARPVTGGRGKTVKSNAQGVFEIKGLKPGAYNLTVTLKSGQMFLVQATAVTGQTVTVELKAPQPPN